MSPAAKAFTFTALYFSIAYLITLGVVELAGRWRKKRLARDKEFIRHIKNAMPWACPLCSYVRWGREMGFEAAFDPVGAHRCKEGNTNPPYRNPGVGCGL